jgi:hypothetical protein
LYRCFSFFGEVSLHFKSLVHVETLYLLGWRRVCIFCIYGARDRDRPYGLFGLSFHWKHVRLVVYREPGSTRSSLLTVSCSDRYQYPNVSDSASEIDVRGVSKMAVDHSWKSRGDDCQQS